MPRKPVDEPAGVSRRDFLKISGITVSVPMVIGPTVVEVAGQDVELHGPGAVPIALTVNGKKLTGQVETRTTLLDALRQNFDVTGPKRVCDRGTCGACTVLMDGKLVYSCSVLAIEAQGKNIVTAEGLMVGAQPHAVQTAFVDHDAQQCGFCTPGFVVATKAFLDANPKATPEQVAHGLGGNFCRCGTYHGIQEVVSAGTARKASAAD
jgi:xanthine dehydrogenase YagT iron-sulfur-binding subunit